MQTNGDSTRLPDDVWRVILALDDMMHADEPMCARRRYAAVARATRACRLFRDACRAAAWRIRAARAVEERLAMILYDDVCCMYKRHDAQRVIYQVKVVPAQDVDVIPLVKFTSGYYPPVCVTLADRQTTRVADAFQQYIAAEHDGGGLDNNTLRGFMPNDFTWMVYDDVHTIQSYRDIVEHPATQCVWRALVHDLVAAPSAAPLRRDDILFVRAPHAIHNRQFTIDDLLERILSCRDRELFSGNR